jgi:hypothetical protein
MIAEKRALLRQSYPECQENPRQSRASTLFSHSVAGAGLAQMESGGGSAGGARVGTVAGTNARVIVRTCGCMAIVQDSGPEAILRRGASRAQFATLVASELQPCENPQVVALHTTINIPANGVREVLDRVISAYEEIDRRFAAAGGLSRLLALYEQLQRELERVSYEEIDRMTGDIKGVIETLLTMDYELRRVNNLKLAFDAKQPGSGGTG